MKNNKQAIPIFFATDDNYVPFLATALESLISNSSKENEYNIHILYSSLTTKSMDSLLKYNKDNIRIAFENVSKELAGISDKLTIRDYYTKTIYFRLFIPNLFPSYKKAIYLDCDVILNEDLSKLYEIDLKNNFLGAVADEIVQITPVFIDYVQNFLNVKACNYFNSGVLLMNLEAMRNEGFEDTFFNRLNSIRFIVAPDQDHLNTICSGRISYLPLEWNKMPIPRKDFDMKDIKLAHFNLSFKPWHYDKIEYDSMFWQYAKKTEFYEKMLELKKNYPLSSKKQDAMTGERLKKMAGYFAYLNKSYREYDFSPDSLEQIEFEKLMQEIK